MNAAMRQLRDLADCCALVWGWMPLAERARFLHEQLSDDLTNSKLNQPTRRELEQAAHWLAVTARERYADFYGLDAGDLDAGEARRVLRGAAFFLTLTAGAAAEHGSDGDTLIALALAAGCWLLADVIVELDR